MLYVPRSDERGVPMNRRVRVASNAVERAALALKAAKKRLADTVKKEKAAEKSRLCRGCGAPVEWAGNGRPRVWCDPCRFGEPYKRWFRSKYGESIRVYQREYRRAYRQKQREAIAQQGQQNQNA